MFLFSPGIFTFPAEASLPTTLTSFSSVCLAFSFFLSFFCLLFSSFHVFLHLFLLFHPFIYPFSYFLSSLPFVFSPFSFIFLYFLCFPNILPLLPLPFPHSSPPFLHLLPPPSPPQGVVAAERTRGGQLLEEPKMLPFRANTFSLQVSIQDVPQFLWSIKPFTTCQVTSAERPRVTTPNRNCV